MAENTSLLEWLDACPTPFHVVGRAASVLDAAGFTSVNRLAGELPRKGYVIRDGSIAAWSRGASGARFRVVGGHTDSPNLRVHPNPDMSAAGWSQLGIEIYGGILLNSWLDRDLGIAGRVVGRDGRVTEFCDRSALARVPQLAVHLDREVNERGVQLDRQSHMMPVWATTTMNFREWLESTSGVRDIVAFDAHLFDVSPASILGADGSLIASGRLDNQLSCWAATTALAAHEPGEHTAVMVLNDHEEVGSDSATGASGPLLESVLTAVCEADGLGASARHDVFARSFCLSADNAHAVHPNYQERHEPRHAPVINRGPALKLNGNQRYATSARGAALVRTLADAHGVPLQTFVTRNNMPCGSTIGPITATRLGIDCIDVGVPQLSMHSARELCGAEDPARLVTLISAFLA